MSVPEEAEVVLRLPHGVGPGDKAPEAYVARFLERANSHILAARERVVRSRTPVYLEEVRALLERELDITPGQWDRLRIELDQMHRSDIGTALAVAASIVRPRMAVDATTTLIPRMKEGGSL